ncbi:structural contituent of cuticle [Holotrichia oblita]|uniref:Structural contituent of cuticle n=1 Tax=Holotrichia oblita TaxID=644536 RepID=A0ACB9TCF2_HOLOL|nr:structural contituent of cuticle [Holotrichia oblita]
MTEGRDPRLSEAEWNNYNYKNPTGPGTYAFGYEVQDTQTSNVQYRNEEKHSNGSVTGNYGYLLPDGKVQRVNYIADEHGYRASVKILPRGNLKPIQLGVPENVLFDFSSNIPPRPSQSVASVVPRPGIVQPITQQFPYNVPNYISTHLDSQNDFMQQQTRQYYPNNFRVPVTFNSNNNHIGGYPSSSTNQRY